MRPSEQTLPKAHDKRGPEEGSQFHEIIAYRLDGTNFRILHGRGLDADSPCARARLRSPRPAAAWTGFYAGVNAG